MPPLLVAPSLPNGNTSSMNRPSHAAKAGLPPLQITHTSPTTHITHNAQLQIGPAKLSLILFLKVSTFRDSGLFDFLHVEQQIKKIYNCVNLLLRIVKTTQKPFTRTKLTGCDQNTRNLVPFISSRICQYYSKYSHWISRIIIIWE